MATATEGPVSVLPKVWRTYTLAGERIALHLPADRVELFRQNLRDACRRYGEEAVLAVLRALQS